MIGQSRALDLEGRSLVGFGQPQQHARQCGLAAPRFADQPECLARPHLEADVDQAVDGLAVHVERLRDILGADQNLPLAGTQRRRLGHRADHAREGRRDLPEVTPGLSAGPGVIQGRVFVAAALLDQAAPVGKHTALLDLARRRRETRDGVERVSRLDRVPTWNTPQQTNRVRVARVVEQLLRRALLHQLAAVQHADAVAHLGDHGQVVADHQQRGVELCAQRGDQFEHLGLDRGVKRRRRLVQDQQRRVGGQCHCDHDALEHASRQLVRVAVHHPGRIRDPHLLEHLLRAVARLRLVGALDLEHLGHLGPDPERGVQGAPGLLVDHRDVVLAELAQVALVQAVYVATVDRDPATADPSVARQIADHRQRDRRLARSGLSDHTHDSPRPIRKETSCTVTRSRPRTR